MPPQTLTCQTEKHTSRQSDGANPNAPFVQFEQRKKVDEDDFRVPIYIHSRIGQSNDKNFESFKRKKLTPRGSRYPGCSIAAQNDFERDPKEFGSPLVNMRKDVRTGTKGLRQVSPSKEQPLKSVRNKSSTGENVDTLGRQAKVTPNQEFQDCLVSKRSRSRQGDTCLQWECGAGPQSNDIGHDDDLVESTRKTDRGNAPSANQTSPAEAINDSEYHDARIGSTIQKENSNKHDNVSQISRVESLSTLKVSPDHVVEIIGQKHFWKARKAIAK